jgi:hypothetical protein
MAACVIEAVTYRLSDHTTADDARRYRPEAEVKEAWDREPLRRLRKAYLVSLNAWNEEDEVELKERCAKYVDAEVNAYLETRSQPVEAMFDYTYAELPDDLPAQRRCWRQREHKRGALRVDNGRAAPALTDFHGSNHLDRSSHPGAGLRDAHTTRAWSCWARTLASTAACSAPRPGLREKFGADRVIDTPLDETTIAGLTVGTGLAGHETGRRSAVRRLHLSDARQIIVCHAARMRNRTRGRLTMPDGAARAPWGGGIRAPEHHSEANEALFTNVPGLRVVHAFHRLRAPTACCWRPSATRIR